MRRLPWIAATILFSLVFTIFMPPHLFGEGYEYYSKGKRDPFISLVTGMAARSSLGLCSVETIEDARLEGIVLDSGGRSMAVLNGDVVKEGDKVYNIEVVKIYYNAVVININGKTHTINLIEEGGRAIE
ncbi:MAG: hypothetical protein U9R52_04225 [Candidatus Omnitrophota bacterium]|nr:hypothetical protein [Candidatus Omnitrophota bacterium]